MKGWRTIAVNVVVAVGSVLVAANWADVLPAQYAWAGVVIVNLLNVGLRYITDTAVGKSA